jgi:hypothetical protein
MTRTITGLFDTRREAEMAVERLVQEHNLDRNRIRAHAEGEENTSGTVVSGADADDAARGERPEGVRRGRIMVSAEVEEGALDTALAAFRECGAAEIGRGPGPAAGA